MKCPYPGINRKVYGKCRIIKKFVWLKKLRNRLKILQTAYIRQKCYKNIIGLETGYLTISHPTKEKNEKYLDWYDVDWAEKPILFLRCINCENELISSGSFVSDNEDGVKYICTDCGRISIWNFDLFAVPVEITDGKYPSPKEIECQKI